MATKIGDARVPATKWRGSVHVSSLRLWPPSLGSKTVQVFIEKNPRVSGPAQFKAMFEGLLSISKILFSYAVDRSV